MTFVEQVADSNGWPATARRVQDVADDTAEAQTTSDERLLARNRRGKLLSRIVEAEILPRLALARVGATAPSTSAKLDRLTTDHDTSELVRLLLGPEEGGAWTLIESLEQRGATPSSLCLGIITTAARRLGEMWEEDRCDFAQVTISLGRLQQVVRALSPSFQTTAVSRTPYADTVLLLPTPGEQHTFGLVILAEFFQREGWNVIGGPVSTSYDPVDLVRGAMVDVVGFSIGAIRHLENLAVAIRAVRRASRNRYLGIMVGGPLFLERPDLVTRVGADTTAADAPSAIRQARGLLAMRAAADQP